MQAQIFVAVLGASGYTYVEALPSQMRRDWIEAHVHAFEFFNGIASHKRSYETDQSTIVKSHLPDAHRFYSEWTPKRFMVWAQSVGAAATSVFEHHLAKPNPELALRTCNAMVEEAKKYGYARFELACERAIAIHSPTLVSIMYFHVYRK
jgi:hypothetical protein